MNNTVKRLIPTNTKYIWTDPTTEKFYYQDETGDIENGPYDSIDDALEALLIYSGMILNPNPAKGN